MNGGGASDSKHENRRQHPRMEVYWHGNLADSGMEEECLVLDISPGGARIQCSDPFERSSSVMLTLAQGDRHDGQIVWRQGSFMGLAFNRLATAA